jgi:hypothetical protein
MDSVARHRTRKIYSRSASRRPKVTDTNQPASLSIIAVSDESEIQEAGPWGAVKGLFVGKKEVPLEKIHNELDRVQAELDDVLSKIDTEPKHGFRLTEVEFSLGISAQGTIGVVSAGVEAGITLTFAK